MAAIFTVKLWPFLFSNFNAPRECGASPEARGECMKRFNSIKKYRDFQKVYKTGKSYANRLLIMYVMRTKEETDTRIGISVSKKVGNSVVRHHITRLLRESYRLNKDMVKTGLDIVVVARAAAKDSNFRQIESAYLHLCGLHNILENRSEKN